MNEQSPPRTVCAALSAAVAQWPDHIFLSAGGRKLSFAETDRESDRLAGGLAAIGVRAGDTVCTLLDTHIDNVLMWLAINKLGAINAPVNTSYIGEYLRHQVADCGARVLVTEAHYIDRVAELKDSLPAIEKLVYRGEATGELPWEAMSLDALREAAIDFTPADVTPDDLSLLIYTSGTTGPSKGCMISHGYACQHARVMRGAHDLRHGDIVWMPLPLFHLVGTCGLVLNALVVGATIELIPRFSVSNFWNEIEESSANFVLMMGSMLALVATAPDNEAQKRCFGQLRIVCGAPLSNRVRDIWLERFGVGAIGSPGYGQTEASIVTRHRIGEPQPEGTSGQRFEDYDVRIVDDEGRDCPPGVAGEVWIRSLVPNGMFDGYWNRPDATAAAINGDWLMTGDLGKFDAEGHFAFVDRKKDYLRKGGENISSMEMEAIFGSHPAIADAAIHAVPSDLAEDDVKVTLVLREGATLDEQDLCAWAIEHIPAFAVPRFYEIRQELPRTPTGKVRKVELRAEGATPQTWDREASPLALRKPAKTA